MSLPIYCTYVHGFNFRSFVVVPEISFDEKSVIFDSTQHKASAAMRNINVRN